MYNYILGIIVISISTLIARLKALPPWLAKARYVWLSLAVIVLALIVSLRPHTSEPVIRITGLILQLLGIATVIWGFSETRALFGHSSFASKATEWFKLFPLLRRDIVVGGCMVSLEDFTFKARAYVTHGSIPSPAIEDRLEALEKNVTLIHERISQTQNQIDQKIRKAEELLKLEQQFRQTDDNSIREKLEATGTGGVHISAIGALWLFVGVVLSTAAIEIAEILK